MLDYSDEEFEPHLVRNRNRSSSPSLSHEEEPRAPVRPREFLPEKNELQLGFLATTQSIFRNFKDKSSTSTVPASNPIITSAFVLNDIVKEKTLQKKSSFQIFGPNLKGIPHCVNNSTLAKSNSLSMENSAHPDSFFKSMKTLTLLAQIFAVLPVSGILGPNYKSLTFKWIHYKTAYWGLTFFGTVFCFICSASQGLTGGAFQAASGIMYFASGVCSSFLMLRLSRDWKKLNKEFVDVEIRFHRYGYPSKIGFKFKIFTICVLVVALVEHILSKLKSMELVTACSKGKYDFSLKAKIFFLHEYSEVFEIFSYNFWAGILVFIAHFLITANWNLKDLFLSTISWTVAERFKQVNDLLFKVHGQDKPVSFWKEVREDYNHLSVLTKRIDARIRHLMFLSMGNNLFFICIQLFHSLRKKIDSIRLVYFFWSFGFLVIRTGFVAFSAARINDESKEPKIVLYSVPQKNYTAEVRRFLTQLTTNDVALTGSGFFLITRSLILTIIGSVITYEIVLVQFGSKEIEDNSLSNRTICLHV